MCADPRSILSMDERCTVSIGPHAVRAIPMASAVAMTKMCRFMRPPSSPVQRRRGPGSRRGRTATDPPSGEEPPPRHDRTELRSRTTPPHRSTTRITRARETAARDGTTPPYRKAPPETEPRESHLPGEKSPESKAREPHASETATRDETAPRVVSRWFRSRRRWWAPKPLPLPLPDRSVRPSRRRS